MKAFFPLTHSLFLCSNILLAIVGCVALSASAAPQPGSIDPTFDPARGPLGLSASQGNSALIQPDGKILVTGEFNAVNLDFAPAVVRFNPDGSLDSGFNASALPASTSLSSGPAATLLALQPNGQILVGGKFNNSGGDTRYLTRLNPDGSLDPRFNPQFTARYTPDIRHVVVLNDGRMLLGGYFDNVNGIKRPGLARLNSDGSLDESFQPAASGNFVVQSTGKVVVSGTNQVVRLNSDGSVDDTFASPIKPPSNSLSSLLIQPDDKLIWTTIQQSFIPEYPTTTERLNANGSDDPSFQPYHGIMDAAILLQKDGKIIFASAARVNPDGTADKSFQPKTIGEFVAQQADGKLITVGGLYDRPYGIRRLFLDGSRDDSFALEIGLTRLGASTIDRASLLPNGKIVIAGNFNYIDRLPRTRLAVLNANGTIDPGFDAGSQIGTRSDGSSNLNALAVQSDGRILVGVAGRLVRLNPDGSQDPSFSYTSSQPGSAGIAAVLRDGKILIYDSGDLARIYPDGTRDTSFQAAEKGTVFVVQPDGKIMLAGSRGIIRLNADGSVDSGFRAASGTSGTGFDSVYTMALQPDGKYLVSRSDRSNYRDVFFRLNNDGSNDASFNPSIASVQLLVVDQTGIIAGGNIAPQADVTRRLNQLGVARLNFDGTRDLNFTPAGFNTGAILSQLLIQPDGQLIVTGKFNQVNGVNRNGIARLNGSAPRQLANISTRASVGRAESVEIGGFIITGNAPKKVILRALGPSLARSGLSNTLDNPFLELHEASGRIIAQNDNWRESQESEILVSGLAPTENAESAIVATLSPGNYTAVIQGGDGGEGIGLAEVYDLDPMADSTLANISTRGMVNAGDGVMIGGFILRGAEASTVVVRALGPSLAAYGISAPLADPFLTVYDQSGVIVADNDNWKQTQRAELEALGMGSGSDNDSALIATLPPGSYTAIVRDSSGHTGVGLVEIYKLD